MNKKIRVIEYTIDDAGLLGVYAISVVEEPAIGVDFVAFASHHNVKFKEDFRGLLYGALLIPDQLIFRVDEKTEEEYYVKYSKETIRAIAYNYLKHANQNNATVEHAKVVDGVSLVETWIIEGENDKSKNFGFDLPEGTWFGCMKVENEEVKKQIQNKEVLGFSIEGNFIAHKETYLSTQKTLEEELQELFNEHLAEIGPKGGVRRSDKAPKSGTPNKDPKGKGSAGGDASGKRGAKVTAEQEKTLQKKADDFNDKDTNTKNGNATLGALKAVFQRGLGAFNTSHSPKVQSAEQWAYARVNAYLYLLKNGRPENPKYTTDYDLLPKKHPKFLASEQEKFAEGQPHYTADGELYEGPTHKSNGRLMTGAEHTEESEYLYHADELKNLDLIVDIEQAIQEEIEERFDDYMKTVNMTFSELKAWSETECSQLASLDRGPINRNLELLSTNKDEWTNKHYDNAGKTIAFINRMRENTAGESVIDENGKECGSKRTISLKNWAYDTNK